MRKVTCAASALLPPLLVWRIKAVLAWITGNEKNNLYVEALSVWTGMYTEANYGEHIKRGLADAKVEGLA